jgi:Na+-translocating ferredoxin:NAD+ oxidoreductase RNF subunit RnfB
MGKHLLTLALVLLSVTGFTHTSQTGTKKALIKDRYNTGICEGGKACYYHRPTSCSSLNRSTHTVSQVGKTVAKGSDESRLHKKHY